MGTSTKLKSFGSKKSLAQPTATRYNGFMLSNYNRRRKKLNGHTLFILRLIESGVSEQNELHDLAEKVGLTKSQVYYSLRYLRDNALVSTGKRPPGPGAAKHIEFAYTYHPLTKEEREAPPLSDKELLAKADLLLASRTRSTAE